MHFKQLIRMNIPKLLFFIWMTILGLFIYLRYHPVNLVTLNDFYIEESQVRRGENITLIIDFEKHTDIAPRVSFTLVDGIAVPLVSAEISRPYGSQRVDSIKTVPNIPSVIPGTYRVQVDLTYRINAFRPDETVTWISEPFEIIE